MSKYKEKEKEKEPVKRGPKKKVVQTPSQVVDSNFFNAPGQDIDKYNLSNDKFYEIKKFKKSERVRHGVGKLVLRHSLPALRLEYPYVYFIIIIFYFVLLISF